MDQLELIVFNVGHGLSVAIIERPENYVTLIDLGAGTGFTPLKHLRLKWQLIPDVLYITHPHADHLDDVGTALLENFQPHGIYYQEYDWADVKGREIIRLRHKIDEFKELISILPKVQYAGSGSLATWRYTPEGARRKFGDATYVNNSSLFLIYSWQQFKIAIAGDLESDGMEGMVNTIGFQQAAMGTDIFIPSHHGHTNGFPSDWVNKIGRPYVSIISAQERDPSVDNRYSSPSFAQGVLFGERTRYALTTRFDGSIYVRMYYGPAGKPTWTFTSI